MRHHRLIAAPALVAALFIALPFTALLLETPWSDLSSIIVGDSFITAFRTTLTVVAISTLLVVGFGTPLAWWLAREDGAAATVVRALVLVPIVLPPVIAGLVLLSAFGRRGLLGPTLEQFGIILPFTAGAAVLAAAFVSLPFYVVAAENGFRSIAPTALDAARTLGTRSDRLLTSVAMTEARPALLAGAVLAAARSLGEFGATITFAGNVEGASRTLPLAAFSALEQDPASARAFGIVLVALAVLVIIALRRSLLGR